MRKRYETAGVFAVAILLAGLWGGLWYQSATFSIALIVATSLAALGAVIYSVVFKRWAVLLSLPLLLFAVLAGELFVAFFLMSAVIGSPVAFLFTLFRPTPENWQVVGQFVFLAAVSAGSFFIYVQLQRAGAREAAERGQWIVRAINQYREREGELPRSLDDLVPGELDSIPDTGMVGFRNFEYARVADEKSQDVEFETYELRVNLYRLLDFDCLVYWPEGNYPDAMYGGGVERIGQWAYVHE